MQGASSGRRHPINPAKIHKPDAGARRFSLTCVKKASDIGLNLPQPGQAIDAVSPSRPATKRAGINSPLISINYRRH
jgi:hypothetical protein